MAKRRSTPHDRTAERIAQKKGTEYNRGKGPDIQTPSQVIEVETPESVGEALQQLRPYRAKSPYIAGTNAEAVRKALRATEGKGVGVMDSTGKIVKRSRRGKK